MADDKNDLFYSAQYKIVKTTALHEFKNTA